MLTRRFALIIGIIYLIIGILGFVPPLLSDPAPGAPDLTVDALYGYLLGIFPVNVLHNIVHLALGIWGIAASRSFDASRFFSRGLAVIFILLAILGLIIPTVFGLIPIFGNDIWLHALTGLIAAYFGWAAPEPAEREVIARR
ncbi:MAG: hypothetical protein KatS3mg057_1132 [Herpetosiphonaceae bacterium]|nr:MAG: hypothetical protein KatS3mg057_1132 [Herpetosiphonaceae bacterium]